MIKLSIIIPVYNSSEILKKLITEINSNLCVKLKNDYEIINFWLNKYFKKGV